MTTKDALVVLTLCALISAFGCVAHGTPDGGVTVTLQIDNDWIGRNLKARTYMKFVDGHVIEHTWEFPEGVEVSAVTDEIVAALRQDGFEVVAIRELGAIQIDGVVGLRDFGGEGFAWNFVSRIDGKLRGLGYAVGK